MKMTVKKGDTVLVIAGREKGKKGTIEHVMRETNRVVVAGINLRKRHLKPGKKHPRGGIVEIAASMHRSNVMVIDPATEKPVRGKASSAPAPKPLKKAVKK